MKYDRIAHILSAAQKRSDIPEGIKPDKSVAIQYCSYNIVDLTTYPVKETDAPIIICDNYMRGLQSPTDDISYIKSYWKYGGESSKFIPHSPGVVHYLESDIFLDLLSSKHTKQRARYIGSIHDLEALVVLDQLLSTTTLDTLPKGIYKALDYIIHNMNIPDKTAPTRKYLKVAPVNKKQPSTSSCKPKYSVDFVVHNNIVYQTDYLNSYVIHLPDHPSQTTDSNTNTTQSYSDQKVKPSSSTSHNHTSDTYKTTSTQQPQNRISHSLYIPQQHNYKKNLIMTLSVLGVLGIGSLVLHLNSLPSDKPLGITRREFNEQRRQQLPQVYKHINNKEYEQAQQIIDNLNKLKKQIR